MEIVNIVASVKFPFTFDLNKIEEAYTHISSRPLNFPAVNLKLHFSDLCQIFANGNIIVLGEKTIEGTYALFNSYLQLLQHLGYPCIRRNLKIQNIIARYDHREKINLHTLARQTKFEYEPDLFPAVRFRLKDLKITVNIFRTGKCMVLGAKSIEDINIAEERLKNLLKNGEN